MTPQRATAPGVRAEFIDAIRRLRAVLPGDPAFGDALSTTGTGGPQVAARATERLVGPKPSATKELSLGALQVWEARRRRAGRGAEPAEVTVLFTDLVAFSSWSLRVGDEATLELLRKVATAIEPPIVEHGGRVVKRLGDGVMAVFESPDSAVSAVVAARAALGGVDVDGYTPRMRAGLHTGMPREIGGDWLGVDVTIAARVMEAGGNGNTMLSEATLHALAPATLGRLGYRVRLYRRSRFAGPLSGVPEDLKIYSLQPARLSGRESRQNGDTGP